MKAFLAALALLSSQAMGMDTTIFVTGGAGAEINILCTDDAIVQVTVLSPYTHNGTKYFKIEVFENGGLFYWDSRTDYSTPIPCSSVSKFKFLSSDYGDDCSFANVSSSDYTICGTISMVADTGNNLLEGSPDIYNYAVGGDNDDDLRGGSAGDLLKGGEGDDEIRGYGGNDVLWGEGGDDSIWGGDGNDTIRGDSGGDYLEGGNGVDSIHCGGSLVMGIPIHDGDDDTVLEGTSLTTSDCSVDTIEYDGGSDITYARSGEDVTDDTITNPLSSGC